MTVIHYCYLPAVALFLSCLWTKKGYHDVFCFALEGPPSPASFAPTSPSSMSSLSPMASFVSPSVPCRHCHGNQQQQPKAQRVRQQQGNGANLRFHDDFKQVPLHYTNGNNDASSSSSSSYYGQQSRRGHSSVPIQTNINRPTKSINVNRPPSSHNRHQTSIDRLQVDLLRSKLSTTMAEERAQKLEKALSKMKQKYKIIRDRLERIEGRQSLERVQQEQKQHKRLRQQQHQHHQGDHSRQKTQLTKSKRGNATKTTNKKSTKAQNTSPPPTKSRSKPFSGNSFDSLPPFAAALAANAEREELEKRMKRGIIEESYTTGRNRSTLSPSFNGSEQEDVTLGEEIEDDAPSDVDTSSTSPLFRSSEERLSSFIDEKKKITPKNDDHNKQFVLEATRNTSHTLEFTPVWNLTSSYLSSGDSTITTFTNESMLAKNFMHPFNNGTTDDASDKLSSLNLEQRCIHLSRQLSTLQNHLHQSEELRQAQFTELKASMNAERVLRGLQSDANRRLGITRKEMDQKEEIWEKRLSNETLRWQELTDELRQRMDILEKERDDLLEERKDMICLSKIFCGLVKEKIGLGKNPSVIHGKNITIDGIEINQSNNSTAESNRAAATTMINEAANGNAHKINNSGHRDNNIFGKNPLRLLSRKEKNSSHPSLPNRMLTVGGANVTTRNNGDAVKKMMERRRRREQRQLRKSQQQQQEGRSRNWNPKSFLLQGIKKLIPHRTHETHLESTDKSPITTSSRTRTKKSMTTSYSAPNMKKMASSQPKPLVIRKKRSRPSSMASTSLPSLSMDSAYHAKSSTTTRRKHETYQQFVNNDSSVPKFLRNDKFSSP